MQYYNAWWSVKYVQNISDIFTTPNVRHHLRVCSFSILCHGTSDAQG